VPVIKALPSPEIIRGLHGVLDFYMWKGLNCVRKWPHIPPAHRTPASLEAAHLFGDILHAYGLIGGTPKSLFIADSQGETVTPRDIYTSALYGHLHKRG